MSAGAIDSYDVRQLVLISQLATVTLSTHDFSLR